MPSSGRDPRQVADDEPELVRRLVAGDRSAFDRFADEYLPPLYRFAARRLGDPELTRDIVQSTFCKALVAVGRFRGEAGLSTWLASCCRNEIADHFRRLGRRPPEVELDLALVEGSTAPPPGSTVPEDAEASLLRAERRAAVHQALDELPPRWGRALEWRYLEELPVAAIAARLEVTPKAAESLLSRARAALRARLGGNRVVAEGR